MAFVPGAGLRFAVPDVQQVKTDAWSLAVGAAEFGPQGEVFRVVGINESASQSTTFPANFGCHLETNTAAYASSATTGAAPLGAIVPFIVGVSDTSSSLWAGILAQSAATNKLVWMQIAGPLTASLTAGAEASAANANFVMTNNSRWVSLNSTDALSIQPGMLGYNGGGHTQSQTTARLHMMAAAGIGLWHGRIGFTVTTT